MFLASVDFDNQNSKLTVESNRINFLSFNRIVANVYKDGLKCLRNKK